MNVIGLNNDALAGYFTTGHRMTEEELAAVKGRSWEEYVLSFHLCFFLAFPKGGISFF
jgi:hypothetical protein